MRALAAWVMARRINALTAAGGFAVFGLVFPPLIILSLAILGLVTMRRGPLEGALLLAGICLFMLIMALAAVQPLWLDFMIITGLWVASWVLALVYRKMAAPAWMIYAAGAVGITMVLGFYLSLDDPAALYELMNQFDTATDIRLTVERNGGTEVLVVHM